MTENEKPADTQRQESGTQGEATPPDRREVPEVAPAPAAAPADREGEPGEAPVPETETLQAELAETKERLLRALAETENIRRRSERDLEDARKYAITSFARELLDVSDNLSRALASVPEAQRETTPLLKTLTDGVAMTERSLHGIFERRQIAKIEPTAGEKFDHNRHQAMFEVESDAEPSGTIAQLVQPGYLIADRLLRPAMVGVAKAKPAPSPSPGGEDMGEGTAEHPAGQRPGERLDTRV